MSRNIMSIGRIMYSKIQTKRKLSDFYGFGIPSIIYFLVPCLESNFQALLGRHDILILDRSPIKWRQRPGIAVDWDI